MSMAERKTMTRAVKNPVKRKLTRAEKKEIAAVIQAAKGDGKPHTAQQTIPYLQMYPDGICRVTEKKYSKSLVFEDINYQLAQADDKTAIFENWCDFLNYFDASVSVQLSFINQGARKEKAQAAIEIPAQDDAFNSIRREYADMLKNQLEKGNNGLEKCKYITFSIEADNLAAAKARLSRIETDVLNNFKVLGVTARPMNGQERLNVLHGIFHPEGEPFRFSWDWLVPSGLSTKDFIAPSSFRFGDGRTFRMGRKLGAVSFLEILAPELNDRMLSDILDLENGIIANLHIRSIDQSEAIKTIKRKITDLDKMKIEEQKKAVRSGYDMDIIPSDLATFGSEAKNLLQDLQSRNERMFLLTFLVVNMADTKRKLDNDVFATAGFAQKNNCALTRLDYLQEAGFMSSIPLGENLIPIQRGLTTSSTAIFIPFITQELFQRGAALYYSYTLSWNIYTNSPHGYGQAKIAGQDRKVFADRAAMEKYLNGRIKAYEKLFTEISPAIPQEYAEQFKVNGQLLPGYTVEGEEIKQPAADISAAAPRTEPGQETEQFAILIDSRTRFDTGEPGGYWLSMPATKEQLHEAMQSVGITADNPQDFFIHGYSDREDRHIALPYDMVCAAQVDELNFLAARLETLDASGIAALNAATQRKNGFENIGQLIDFTYNEDFFVHIPEVHTPRELGDYYLNKSGMVQMPAEWKNSIDPIAFGRNAAAQEKGSFTEYGYLVESGDAWEKHFEGRDVPEDYRIMSYPQPTVELDAAPAVQAAVPEATPQEPRPVIPIVLTSEKPAEKLKEITDRLEQGITELFDSERYKEYLRVMSKFHNYSFNNTLLIAMQKPDASLIAGFSAWKNNFGRNVMKGQKGIKILAPSPFKIKKEMEKIDPQTQKVIIGKDGKPVTEEKEITIPAFKVVSVFDVSQTEGRELPDIAVNMLTGDVEHYKDVFAALEKTSPVPVAFEKIEGGAHGYYHLEDKRIALDEGMSELQTLKTLIHEIAHAKLHDIDLNAPLEDLENRPDRRTREVQAESIAYTVCQHYGLDTSDYSFGYVAGWSAGRELSELKSSLETIRSTAAEIINSIDEHIAELQKAQEQAQTSEVQEIGQDAPPQEQPEIPVPDATISIKEMQDYGYSWDGMFPLKQEAAERLFTQDGIEVFRIYEDGTEGAVTSLTDLQEHAEKGGLFGVEKETWEALYEYNAMEQQLRESEPTKEALLLYGKEDSYGIYQLAHGDTTRDLRFEPYDRLQATGHTVDRANYELIYTAPFTADITLNSIWEKFNIDHPKDFKGHSLSISDIVVLHQNGENTAHYVDSGSFRNVPEFLQEKQSQLIPDEHLTGEQIRTPRGSFYVSDMSVEQMKEAGYGLHHQSDDGKYLIMGNGTRAFAVAAEQPEKANPLKHIEDTIEQNDNNFDGIINNTPQTPTVDALEQKAKAGEVISLVDLAEAIKTDRENGRGKKAAAKEKPSIRAQLKADKERAGKKKPTKQKSQDLERS